MTLVAAGAEWCALYPTSRSLDDLAEPFRTSARAFVADLEGRGCTVKIAATLRPPERAYLMRYAWDIAHGTITPDRVPPYNPPIPIIWTVEGAREMVATYALAVRPSLTSLHIRGLAIDCKIVGWTRKLEELYALGASHGVHKLRSDPPHWSSTGH